MVWLRIILFSLTIFTARPLVLRRPPVDLPKITPERNFCYTSRYTCINCTTAIVCAPTTDNQRFEEVKQVTCSGETPFCDSETGTCTSTQSEKCALEERFVCVRDGYFPDQTDCDKFHFCHNSKSSTITCPLRGQHYDSNSASCVHSDTCHTFDCNNRNGYKVTYTGDPSIYAYCVENTPLVVDRCLGEDQLNENSQKCEPVCTREGLMEDTADCKSYYECSIETTDTISPHDKVTYTKTHHRCQGSDAYSPTHFQCKPFYEVPDCPDPFD